jgi:hypothetical protein
MVTKMKAQFDYLTAKMDAYLEGTKECWEVIEARNQRKPRN